MTRSCDDAAAALTFGPPHGGFDFRSGVKRQACPFLLATPDAVTWLDQWDAAAEQSAFVLRVIDGGLGQHYGVIRDALLSAHGLLASLRGSKAISPMRARHRDCEIEVGRALGHMPERPNDKQKSEARR